MKITIITDTDPDKFTVGGIHNYLRYLIPYLKKRKINVEIIGRIRPKSKKNSIFYDNFIGLNCKNNYIFMIKLIKFFFRNLDTNVIFAQRADFMFPFIFKKCKKIIVFHGNPFSTLLDKKGQIVSAVYSMLERISIRNADLIIVVNNAAKDYLKDKYSLNSKVILIPPAVDTKIFKPKDQTYLRGKYNFKIKDKIVLYVGRFSIEKQLDFIVHQITKIKDVKLVLVGEGKYKFDRHKNLKLLKPIVHEKLSEIINCADCLVLFSKYEGMPTVVLEALACGKPVISSNVGDIKKIVINGKTGFLTTKKSFLNSVKKVLHDPLLYKDNCVKIAYKYSWDKIANNIIKLIQE